MSILTMTIADQLSDDALGPVLGSAIRRDTRKGRIARAAKSAACMALVRHLAAVEPGDFHYASPGFAERLAEARRVAAEAVEAEVRFLEGRGA